MGYNKDQNASGSNGSNGSDATPKKKALGYINIYLPTRNGEQRKVGAIALFNDDPRHVELNNFLEASVENQQKFSDKLIIGYNSTTPVAGSEFDLF